MIPIIMLTYNRVEYSMEVLAAFKNHLLYPHKVIVIDNASTDGTREYLDVAKKLGFIDHLILNDTNLGIAEPKNQGLKVVEEWAKTEPINFVCITDNDIVPPFIRDDGCVLTKIVEMMDGHPEVGMCGVELDKSNCPDNTISWWWRLRQHPATNPTFAEISIGFWFSVIRYEYFKEFSFKTGSALYGRVDESIRNWVSLNKRAKIGLLKGVYNKATKETIPKAGYHLGWKEDSEKFPSYVTFKKQERYKAEIEWKENGRKW